MIRCLAFCLLLCLLHSCQQDPAASSDPVAESNLASDPWLAALHQTSDSLDLHSFYLPRAGLYTPSGQFLQGHDTLLLQWQGLLQEYPIQDRNSMATIFHDSSHYYELGHYLNAAQKPILAYLIAWKKDQNASWKRDLEILHPYHSDLQPIPPGIDRARRLWESHSNAHDPVAVIENCYTPEAIYFNGGRVAKGRNAIIQRYQYMIRPQWKIQLHPRQFMGLSKDLVFEVGQYQSSGVGHYFLFWQRQTDQNWQALLDYNF